MTDFELYYLVLENTSTAFSIFTTYLTIIFAFLVAGHLMGHKISTGMTVVMIALFSLASLICVMVAVRAAEGMAGLAGLISKAIADGQSNLSWMPYGSPNSRVASTMLQTGFLVLLVLAYIGALVFFFQQRRAGLKAAA